MKIKDYGTFINEGSQPRTELEKQLAILTLKNELKNAPEFNMFGTDNHKIINLGIDIIEGRIDEDDLWDMEESGEIDDDTRSQAEEFIYWLTGSGDELENLLFDDDSLVTELPTEVSVAVEEKTYSNQLCQKICGECPFSKNSMKGFLATYTRQDFADMMSSESSFPCHMRMGDQTEDTDTGEAKKAIDDGKMVICRGYVESIIKSAKSPYRNEQLVNAIKQVKEDGLSEESMDIFEFWKHHDRD